MADEQEGIPLMAPDEYVHDFHRGVAQVSARSFKDQDSLPPKSRWSSLTTLLILTCLFTLLSLVSNFITFAINRSPSPAAGSLTKLDASMLRRPSLYLGLERVPAIKLRHGQSSQYTAGSSSSLPGNSRTGWPSAIARVNSVHSGFVFPQDGWVFLTEQDHAIIEFPAIPNVQAGQKCVFKAHFPARRALEDKLLTIERDDGLSPDPEIRLIPLSFSSTLFNRLTWDSRPTPLSTTDTPISLLAAFGQNQTSAPFACPSDGPLRVEAMCAGGGCRVEYDASTSLVDVEPLLGIQLVVK